MKRVACVAVMHDGKMLMGMRQDNGRWTNTGGHLEENEEPIDGARREVEEEAGIKLEESDLKHLKTETVTKPSGEKLKVYAYLADLDGRPATTMKEDPDAEVHRWHWIDVSNGTLPDKVTQQMHVPLHSNVLMKALGIESRADHFHRTLKAKLGQTKEASMEKVAFWIGFEKAAMMPSLNPVRAAAAGFKNMAGKVTTLAKAHPKTALGLGAGGAFMAGRMSKGQQPQPGQMQPGA